MNGLAVATLVIMGFMTIHKFMTLKDFMNCDERRSGLPVEPTKMTGTKTTKDVNNEHYPQTLLICYYEA